MMPSVFFFGNGQADGHAQMKNVLGGKGANLAEMTNLGIPVPPGFTISAGLCIDYLAEKKLPNSLLDEVREAMAKLEAASGRSFGDPSNPLLVSVRSGAKFSMPGMMNTILNLGLNDKTVEGLIQQGGGAGNKRFAYDSYRRLVQMYGDVVFGIKPTAAGEDRFEAALEAEKKKQHVERDIDLDEEHLRELVAKFKGIVERQAGHPFPEHPWDQLWGAIEAVFRSWNTRRAVDYRRINRIPDDLGTAVNVQAMVYGNLGEDSASGVAFTRNPSTGEKKLFGEFLTNAQGEDVVSGTRDPEPVSVMADRLPEAFQALEETCEKLEKHYKDMQDVEFTVERGRLYMLQTRAGKRTAHAAVRVAVEMVNDELISEQEAVARVEPDQLDQLLHPAIDPQAPVDLLAKGLPASPGAAVGQIVFDADTAAERGGAKEAVILVRRETSPEDFHGMVAAQAILTARGGMTSHAAVVARGMGKSCVAGCKEIDVNEEKRQMRVNGRVLKEGDWITLDGSTGRVINGKVPLVEASLGDYFQQIMTWADKFRMLRVRTNADTPKDSQRAREFGAEGIGLCRTEHMFFEGDRIDAMRQMILATDLEGRRRALLKLLPMQRDDFVGIFRAMDGFPVTIRLLDPPLHEFLPHGEEEIRNLAKQLKLPAERLHHTISTLTEANPMLGHRGCRLGISYPEITEMQAQAIFEAACQVTSEGGEVYPEVMVPLVAHVEERQAKVIQQTAERVFAERKQRVEYLVGTMIELPRACLSADEIAEVAEFFSFGTNDLTQTTFGLSRDDAGRFLPLYIEQHILADDPFQTLDQGGVGKLVEMGVRLGRETNPKLKIGICGEHGGDPSSPFRVPIARLAAAQVALAERDPSGAGAALAYTTA
jgi:pyruvate,orthophosphate dikinase